MCRFPYPGCFRGDERLEINVTEEDRLDHLAFDKSAADLQERFIGENDSSFGNRANIAAEPKILEVLQERVAKQRGAGGRFHRAQEPDVVVAEFHVQDGPDCVLKSRGDGIAAVERTVPEIEVERGRVRRFPLFEIGCRHREFIKIRQQRARVHGVSFAGRQSAVGSRQSAVGSRQSAVGSRQSAVGSRQSAVGSRI